MLLGEDRDGVGADLVGGIAVGGDAVGADNHGGDAALAHEVAAHVVADEGGGDVVLEELPGGEARALVEGAGLIGEDVDLPAGLNGRADDAESGAVAAGGQRAGVAVGEDGAFLGQKLRAERAELAEVGDVFVVQGFGERDDVGLDLRNGSVLRGEAVVELTYLGDAPEEVDGGGAGLRERVADDGDFGGEVGEGFGGGAVDAERNAHRRGDADGHGAAYDHVLDHRGYLLVVGGEDVGFFVWELGLVEEADAFGRPFEGGDHVRSSLAWR